MRLERSAVAPLRFDFTEIIPAAAFIHGNSGCCGLNLQKQVPIWLGFAEVRAYAARIHRYSAFVNYLFDWN